MRDILFRGKRIDNGEWIEGYYVKTVDYFTDSAVHLIIELPSAFYPRGEIAGEYEINSSTIGQFTGLTDKNGRKIFEGDIVGAKHPEQRKAVPCLVGFGEFEDVDSLDNYNYMGWFLKAYGKCLSILEPEKDGIELEVIGNIYDNPELLEVEE